MSPHKKKGQYSSDEIRYLKYLPELLKGTGKGPHDRDVRIDPHLVLYWDEEKKGQIHSKAPSKWYAEEVVKAGREKFGYELRIIRQEDYEQRKKKLQAQRDTKANKKSR